MRLVAAVLGFVLRKVGLLVAMVASLFVVYLVVHTLVPPVREAVAERDRLLEVTEERAALEGELERLQRAAETGQIEELESFRAGLESVMSEAEERVADAQAAAATSREDRDEVCGFVAKVLDLVLDKGACATAEAAVEAADRAVDSAEAGVGEVLEQADVLADPTLSPEEKLDRLGEGGDRTLVDAEIESTRAALNQKRAEEASLRETQDSPAGLVVSLWAQSWRWLVGIALLALLLPPVLRTVNYFVLMPLVRRAQTPIHLAAGADFEAADLHATAAERTLTVPLNAGEVLSARSEHVRPVQGKIRSQLLYDWRSPFISFAAGLYGLSRITGDEAGTSATLATPDDPDSYLMRIDFSDHPGVVMRPTHVVGVIGSPELRTRWRWGIQALATWQVRYVMFAGTGSLIVQGCGDVAATHPGSRSTRMDQHLVMGFDSRLTVSVNRTEVFLPYLWRRTPLVDDEFMGPHPLFWQKSSAEGPSNPLARAFDTFFSAFGKLLGF